MHTLTLQAIKHPSRLAVLLHDLVQALDLIPAAAYEVADRGNLPATLRRVAQCATHLGASWACWLDDAGGVWFFVAEMALELSRERGAPVLQLDRYGDDGLILETSRWQSDQGHWSRLPTVSA